MAERADAEVAYLALLGLRVGSPPTTPSTALGHKASMYPTTASPARPLVRIPASRVLCRARATLGLLCVLAFACQPEVGDSCANAADCSVQDSRTCDTTLPGGYCTIFGCGADTCPEEATCIGFQSVISVAPECSTLDVRPRLQRTACMRACSVDGDCRAEYACVEIGPDNPWGATVVDRGRGNRVCTLPPPPTPTGASDVCAAAPPSGGSGPDGGFEVGDAGL